MRLGCIGLLAVTFLSNTEAQKDSHIIHRDYQILARSLVANHDYPTSGFLNFHEAEDDEERLIPLGSFIEKTKAFVSPATTEKLQTWLNNGKSIDKVFVRLQLTKAEYVRLDNPQFKMWLTYVDDFTAKYPGQTTSAIATLTTHYSEIGVAKFLAAAKKVKGTKEVATKLEAAQMQAWLAGGKTADDVFELLKLKIAGDDNLINPVFTSWITYLKIFNTAHPDKKTSIFAKLTSEFGELGVSRLVETTLKVKSSSAIAKSLQAEQFERWMAKKTPGEVFTLLGLHKANERLPESTLFNTFTKYMVHYNKWNPDQEITLIGTLTTYYGRAGVVKLLEAWKNAPSTLNLATNLESAQYKLWMTERKTPDGVFTMLGLEAVGKNLLLNPLFTAFTKFTDVYHAKNPSIKMTTNWIVRAHYDDFDVAQMILAAEKIPSAQSAGKRMEAVLFKDWMTSPNEAFMALKLDQVNPSQRIKSPMFLYWMKFMDDFNKSFPGKVAIAYKDEELVKMVEMAQSNPTTKDLAKKLEAEMLMQFTLAKKQPIDVANLLHVKEKTDANWKLWKKYTQDYHRYQLGGGTI